MLVSFVIVLLTIGSTSISATNYARFNLLKDDRAAGRLVFIPTTLAQREVILSNVKNTLTIAHYKSAADPFPIVEKLRRNIKTITDKELQLGLTDAFIMARDHHTRWTNMAPYGCFYATTGVTFTFVEGDADIANKPTVVVISTSKHPVIRPLFGKDYSKIQAGDELLAINGLSFVEWFKQNQFTSGAGANDFGGQRAALKYLTTIYGKANRLPSDDSIKFQFKSRANPHTSYTVNVPYVSGHDEDCWNLGSKLYKSITSKTLPGTPETSLPVSAKQSGDNQESNTAHLSPKGRKMDNPKDSKREIAMGKISSSRQGSAILMSPTGVTKVTWGIYQPESTNMGIIKLNSFDPEDVGTTNLAVLKSVMVIRSLLVNELKDTKSVMFDLRGNSGGDTEFANNMVQLFKPDFQPFGHRYLMNKITFNLFVDGEDPNADIYAKAWKETEPNSRFTKVFFPNSVEHPGTRCWNHLWRRQTDWCGGAAVMELDPFLVTASPDDFQKFPFSQELTSGSTTTRKYTPQLASSGCSHWSLRMVKPLRMAVITADTVFRPRWSDLQPNPTTNTQYDRIAEKTCLVLVRRMVRAVCILSLSHLRSEKPIGNSHWKLRPLVLRNSPCSRLMERLLSLKKEVGLHQKTKVSIPVSAAGSTLGNNRITIVGKTAGKQVLKTNRNVRTIPTNGNYMKISTLGFIFEGISNSVGLYQSSATAPADGWNNLKGPWMIGTVSSMVKMSILPLRLSSLLPLAPRSMLVSMSLSTLSPDMIASTCLSRGSGGVEDFLLRSKSRDGTKTFDGISGRKRSVRKIIPFTTKSKRFSVSLRFTSDEVVEFAGATINSFTVSAA
ncbi:hypothetical protein BASA83_004516 [Batrachochytrium salamandrivorans]|nr:hypothetical protein BASA83_004516 [Batrachochytrium salamandrivorans]